MGKLTGLDQ